jgi:hypothetical protein
MNLAVMVSGTFQPQSIIATGSTLSTPHTYSAKPAVFANVKQHIVQFTTDGEDHLTKFHAIILQTIIQYSPPLLEDARSAFNIIPDTLEI